MVIWWSPFSHHMYLCSPVALTETKCKSDKWEEKYEYMDKIWIQQSKFQIDKNFH